MLIKFGSIHSNLAPLVCPIALTIRAISGQFIINQGNDFDGTENFSIETHRGSSLIVVGAGAEKTGGPISAVAEFFCKKVIAYHTG